MFESSDRPRVFGLPCGIDFAAGLAYGILQRTAHTAPEYVAKIEIYVNTRRMQRRLRDVFDAGNATLLPKIRLVTDLARDPIALDIPPPVAPLRRRLELSQFVLQLLKSEPDLAPRSALYDLSDSLAALMDEMHGEGVDPEAVLSLDVSDTSDHWARTQKFIRIIEPFFDPDTASPDVETRQRMVVNRLITTWESEPPSHPIIIAGSTGSRGATSDLMHAVARLPQGAIILPGFDEHLPEHVWAEMKTREKFEDHPQFRFKLIMDALELKARDIETWSDAQTEPNTARNRLISLSLRPAPVTNQWRSDGPSLGDLNHVMDDVTLVEAPSPRAEAETIALRLRAAIEDGQKAALITPDRVLTRQVAAALSRWNVIADDSAGHPLHLSAPGRLIRQIGALRAFEITGETLLSLLKHPLVSTGGNRGHHLLSAREFELHVRREGLPFPTGEDLRAWAAKKEAHTDWANWVAGCLDQIQAYDPSLSRPLANHIEEHIALAETIANGPNPEQKSGLWDEATGRKAKQVLENFGRHADAGGEISARDYNSMVGAVLQSETVRTPDESHPLVQFLGTLEARVQTADLIILGGMNDGSWPEAPRPDPWLNREMRASAGLLLPERRIGLSAHDYQQAVGAREVWITRAIRSDEAETVPSRWINRLTNLLAGLTDQGGQAALDKMRTNGSRWVEMARMISAVEGKGDPAPRPSPRPPVEARPNRMSVTEIKNLIRDPYSIYAKHVLKLKKLDPLVPNADPPLRGNIIHEVLDRFIRENLDPDTDVALERFNEIAQDVLDELCPWPTARRLWFSRISRAAPGFLADEVERRKRGEPKYLEIRGELFIEDASFRLVCKADRIDETPDGRVILYDYKTGSVPTIRQQKLFDKQLILEAAMVEKGAFDKIGSKQAEDAEFIQIKDGHTNVKAPFKDAPVHEEWDKFLMLLKAWRDPERGYSARLATFSVEGHSDYDHLSRYGEWDLSTQANGEEVE